MQMVHGGGNIPVRYGKPVIGPDAGGRKAVLRYSKGQRGPIPAQSGKPFPGQPGLRRAVHAAPAVVAVGKAPDKKPLIVHAITPSQYTFPRISRQLFFLASAPVLFYNLYVHRSLYGGEPMNRHSVFSGIDRIHLADAQLKGRRVGLMTNPTGIDHQLTSTIDIVNTR
jgi:hypothetical protein